MNEAIYELIGNEVEVRSNTGDDDCLDSGILEAFDYPWLRIRTAKKEVLCFPVHNVRLVKLLKVLQPTTPPKPEEVLLRPLGAEPRELAPRD
jgi:hypothetical protein